MLISFPCPSTPHPIGGLMVLYEFANGLHRRGHEVHLIHGSFWGRGIDRIEDLDWFEFEPGLIHHVVGPVADWDELPRADVFFGTVAPRTAGLPVTLVQGREMLAAEVEAHAHRTPSLRVCVASWLADALVETGAPPEQVVVVPPGVDQDLFVPRRDIRGRGPKVAMLHHEHPAKGSLAGIFALEQVKKRVPELELILFGTPERGPEVPEWATYLRSPSQEALVAEVYNEAAIFVQPSFYEGFGYTAVEAMACGCALVSTDNGGSRDYALDGETALVVPPDDWGRTLVDPVLRLLGDEDLRVRLARAGERFVRRFDWDLCTEMLEAHLERYVADPESFGVEPLPAR